MGGNFITSAAESMGEGREIVGVDTGAGATMGISAAVEVVVQEQTGDAHATGSPRGGGSIAIIGESSFSGELSRGGTRSGAEVDRGWSSLSMVTVGGTGRCSVGSSMMWVAMGSNARGVVLRIERFGTGVTSPLYE